MKLDYYNKYLKYKLKYNFLKKQLGGQIELDNLKTNILNNKRYPFPRGNYTIHIKMLSDDNINKDKICHHYSLFSLYDIPSNTECCSIDSKYFKQLLKPECNHGSCEFKDSCLGNKVCNATELLKCEKSCEKIKYKVRLYNFSDEKINDTHFFPHSSRFENGLWWHKFNGNNCLFSIEEEPDFFKYKVVKEISIDSYAVPNSKFKESLEQDIVFKLTI